MNVNDHIRFPRPGGTMGVWRITSHVVGGEGQESVYGITVVDAGHPRDEWGIPVATMYVPAVLLEAVAEMAVGVR